METTCLEGNAEASIRIICGWSTASCSQFSTGMDNMNGLSIVIIYYYMHYMQYGQPHWWQKLNTAYIPRYWKRILQQWQDNGNGWSGQRSYHGMMQACQLLVKTVANQLYNTFLLWYLSWHIWISLLNKVKQNLLQHIQWSTMQFLRTGRSRTDGDRIIIVRTDKICCQQLKSNAISVLDTSDKYPIINTSIDIEGYDNSTN